MMTDNFSENQSQLWLVISNNFLCQVHTGIAKLVSIYTESWIGFELDPVEALYNDSSNYQATVSIKIINKI